MELFVLKEYSSVFFWFLSIFHELDGKLIYIWDDLANPKKEFNLVPNPK